MSDERLEKIRARVARLRAAGPIDVAAGPAVNALRMIAQLDADDLAFLLDENKRLRRERDEAYQGGIEDQIAADVHTWEAAERELDAVAAERDRLQSALAGTQGRTRGASEAALVESMQAAWDDFVSDTGCYPDCFEQRGRKLYADFRRGNFIAMALAHLQAQEAGDGD